MYRHLCAHTRDADPFCAPVCADPTGVLDGVLVCKDFAPRCAAPRMDFVDDGALTDAELERKLLGSCLEHLAIRGCVGITRVPRLDPFAALETLSIHGATIPEITGPFPDTLRSLHITYSCVAAFAPTSIAVARMAQIDLSFNRLTAIPACLWGDKGGCAVSLQGNDFWYAAFSGLSNSRVDETTAPELLVAYRLGVVGTRALLDAQGALRSKGKAVPALDAAVNEFDKRPEVSTHVNAENVHLASVQTSSDAALRWLLAYRVKRFTSEGKIAKQAAVRKTREVIDAAGLRRCVTGRVYEVLHQVVLVLVDRGLTDFSAVVDELRDGADQCLTGRISRLVNALNGLVPEVRVGIGKQEELLNAVIAVRRKYAALFPGDPEAYVAEAVPAVWQLLEDGCVPWTEHAAWLEYV